MWGGRPLNLLDPDGRLPKRPDRGGGNGGDRSRAGSDDARSSSSASRSPSTAIPGFIGADSNAQQHDLELYLMYQRDGGWIGGYGEGESPATVATGLNRAWLMDLLTVGDISIGSCDACLRLGVEPVVCGCRWYCGAACRCEATIYTGQHEDVTRGAACGGAIVVAQANAVLDGCYAPCSCGPSGRIDDYYYCRLLPGR